jgi:hypothetical protein
MLPNCQIKCNTFDLFLVIGLVNRSLAELPLPIDIAELSRIAINMIGDSITSVSPIKRRILLNSKLIIRKSFVPITE